MSPDGPRSPRRTQRRGPTVVSTLGVLALGVLGALACLVPPVLLALDLTRVTSDKPGLLERTTQLGIGLQQGARDAVSNRDRLRRDPTALHLHVGAVLGLRGRDLERLVRDHARRFPAEVRIEWAFVDDDLARARLEPHTRDRRLAFARRPDHGLLCAHCPLPHPGSGAGFCASCGWSGPA